VIETLKPWSGLSEVPSAASGYAGNICLDEPPRCVSDHSKIQFVLDRIDKLDIPDGVWSLLHSGSDTLVVFCTDSYRPLDRGAGAN
jgi:hypothetical protein